MNADIQHIKAFVAGVFAINVSDLDVGCNRHRNVVARYTAMVLAQTVTTGGHRCII